MKRGKFTLLWLALLLSQYPNSGGVVLSGGGFSWEGPKECTWHAHSTDTGASTGTRKPGRMGRAGEVDVEIAVGTSEQEPD